MHTSLNPSSLLQALKGIESTLGRVKVIENGPRPIDLDILLYDQQTVIEKDLIIPHLKLKEREFVLRPLVE